ncbi:fumarylacetoacetate hydrolase family protein [Alphaproteobacteria bacterium]|jgi:fumarylpyruvate hydrolase|nr:fumarylacetoacetate hydrolase family protein [Alphaproteobacteria bacterium]MDC0462403.1 fumarylacetoacetate hydrolase family protein [Alphaproteobacteria bacterium]
MNDYVIAEPTRPTLPVKGSKSVFPVRRVYCIGRNYAEHAREMGHDPDRDPPFFFQKNADNIITNGRFKYPVMTEDVHHEVEMIVGLKSGGKAISVADANNHIFGYGIGFDMTRRDLQQQAKNMGRPWEVGKAFEQSAPCGELIPIEETGIIEAGAIKLTVNGESRQDSDLSAMIWSVPEMISILSEYFELASGDVIMSGTPAGVNSVKPGDTMTAFIEGLGELTVFVD